MVTGLSLDELAHQVNAWCEANGILPVSGQAAEAVTERSIRYYRTLSLVDGPNETGPAYGEKHLLQLCCLRLLQAQGVPLRRIRELLYGRSFEQLKEVQRRGLADAKKKRPASSLSPAGEELWRMIPLDAEFTLVSRTGQPVSATQREAILRILQPTTET